MNEIFLGRPLLQCIGLDLEKIIQDLVQRDEDINVAGSLAKNFITYTIRLTAAKYRGVLHTDVDSHPIDPIFSTAATMGIYTKAEIDEAINATLDRKTQAGLSATGLENERSLLLGFCDVLHIKLESDAPIKFNPTR